MIRNILIGASLLALAACSSGGTPLAPGLTASMDAPGAVLDRNAALNIVNHYRAANGVSPLTEDPGLSEQAAELAQQYARTGTAPNMPEGANAIRVSAGYSTFAETFSGWRNSPKDAAALIDPRSVRAGIGVYSDPSSEYGVHWVMIFAPAAQTASAQ